MAFYFDIDTTLALQKLKQLRQPVSPRHEPPDDPPKTPPPAVRLEVTADSSPDELRAFIDRHCPGVKKNLGGPGRRTKAHMYADIVWAMAPRTAQKPRRREKLVESESTESSTPGVRALEVTGDSSLDELKAFIDTHDLEVKTNVGGTAGRTKADIYDGINPKMID